MKKNVATSFTTNLNMEEAEVVKMADLPAALGTGATAMLAAGDEATVYRNALRCGGR